MCLYTKTMYNPKYKANKKNGGVIPPLKDNRIAYVPIACGKCIECKKKKSREWQVRLLEDIKHNRNGKFITLTFEDKAIAEICEYEKTFRDKETGRKFKAKIGECEGYERDNQIATVAVRLFLERWRKEYGKSLRHWLVTEIGHNGTENIHLHGIIWTDETAGKIRKIWKYGYVWAGKKKLTGEIEQYVNERTVGYITKYITKVDEKHRTYESAILCSAGIGGQYVKRVDAIGNRFNGIQTKEYYRTSTGHKMTLPIYWRNKIYNEEEREKLWIQKLDKETRWVMGEKVDISEGEEQFKILTEYYRNLNKQWGYQDGYKNYDKEQEERKRRAIMQETRIQKGKKK